MDKESLLEEHQYITWEIRDSKDYNWNDVSYDGHGYIITKNNERFDSCDDLYRKERLYWNSLKNLDFIYIKIGRWLLTNEGIETQKDNNQNLLFNFSDLWELESKKESLIYFIPNEICRYGWVSNLDILDFNSVFMIFQEKFSYSKPENFPEVSWTGNLIRQYKRFDSSFDINSFEGRTKFEKEKTDNKSFDNLYKENFIDIEKTIFEKEIFGDNQSRK